jgi:hypothetical protein
VHTSQLTFIGHNCFTEKRGVCLPSQGKATISAYLEIMIDTMKRSSFQRHHEGRHRVAGRAALSTQRLVGPLLITLLCIGTFCQQWSTVSAASCFFSSCTCDGSECNNGGSCSCYCFCSAYAFSCIFYTAVPSCSCLAGYGGDKCQIVYCTNNQDCSGHAVSVSGFAQAAVHVRAPRSGRARPAPFLTSAPTLKIVATTQ